MSIASEIQRLQTAKSEIKKALSRKGIVISNSDTLDEYAAVIDPVTQGKDITYFDNPNGYLSFKYIGSGSFRWCKHSSFNVSLQYSKDAGTTWTTIAPDHTPISMADGDEIWVKGTGSTLSTSTSNYGSFNTTAKKVYVSGNVNSLINFGDVSAYCFDYLFSNNSFLDISKEKQLSLLATTLANNCYSYMFNGCTSLTTAPELPATRLASNCYSYMFSGCNSLNYIKAMFTTTPSLSYTNNWVKGVASSGTFVKNSAATWSLSGNNGIPSGWTVQTASE